MEDKRLWDPLTVIDWCDSLINMLEERKKEILRYIYRNGQWYNQDNQQVQLKPNLSHIEHQQSPGLSGFMPESVQKFLSECAGQPIQRYSDLEALGLTLDKVNYRRKEKKESISDIFHKNYSKAKEGLEPALIEEPGKNEEYHQEGVPTFFDVMERAKEDARRKHRERKRNR